MTTALLWYLGVCGALGAVLILIMVVQAVTPVLARMRSSVAELPQPQLERPLRPAA